MKFCFVLNGRDDLQPVTSRIQHSLEEYQASHYDSFQYDTYTTEGEGDATRHVRIYCDLHPNEKVCFVACGGDGMINEVVSGLVGFENKSLGILAIGGGVNDFIMSVPGRDFQSIDALVKGKNRNIDIIRINDNYALNVCNFGFSSIVASVANSIICRGGSNPFRKGIAAALFYGRYNRIHVTVDGKQMPGRRMLLCTISNGQYVGGEFRCAPKAQLDDGLIDVCYSRTMSLISLLRSLSDYKKGLHVQYPKYRNKYIYRQGKHVEVSAPNTIYLCLDGEMLPGSNFMIDVLPGAISFRDPGLQA